MIKVCFTFDDGKKSQLQFINRIDARATYFILPEMTEAKSLYEDRFSPSVCKWNEVRALSKKGEIGFHGFSRLYNKIGKAKTESRIKYGLDLIETNVGVRPVSFAYTNMIPTQIGMVSKMFPYIRDYFWRDLVKDGNKQDNYVPRMSESDVPSVMLQYRKKIFCIHPSLDPVYQLKRMNRIEEWGYEYVIIIMHEVGEKEILIGRILSEVYDTCTFREIFEGRSRDTGGNPQPATVTKTAAEAGSTPAASPK